MYQPWSFKEIAVFCRLSPASKRLPKLIKTANLFMCIHSGPHAIELNLYADQVNPVLLDFSSAGKLINDLPQRVEIARVFGQPVQPGSTVTVALTVQRNPS